MAGIPSGNNIPGSSGNIPADGGNVLRAGNNIPPSTVLPPGSPTLWFDAQDVNLLANVGISDADPIGTWKNKGSLGSAADLLQATGALKPLFRRVATTGKINGLSAIQSDGTQWMLSAAFTNQPAANTHAMLFRPTDFSQQGDLYDGGTNRNILFWSATTGALNLYAGSAVTATSQTLVAATWELCVTQFNGATSWNRFNGAQSANLNPGTGALNRFAMWSDSVGTAGTIAKAMVAEHLCWNGTAPAAADIEAYFLARYGATPQ